MGRYANWLKQAVCKTATLETLLVQIQPGPPRQKKSTPFRFRGLRKSRENFISVDSFFLLQIGPAKLGSDLDGDTDLHRELCAIPNKHKWRNGRRGGLRTRCS